MTNKEFKKEQARLGYTNRVMALIMGVDISCLERYRNGKTVLSGQALKLLAYFKGLSEENKIKKSGITPRKIKAVESKKQYKERVSLARYVKFIKSYGCRVRRRSIKTIRKQKIERESRGIAKTKEIKKKRKKQLIKPCEFIFLINI